MWRYVGVVFLTLVRGEFKNIREDQLIERVVTGDDPDPYVIISAEEPGSARVLDSCISTEKVYFLAFLLIYSTFYKLECVLN